METCAKKGLVTCSSESKDASEWELTKAGVSELEVTRLLSAPEVVLTLKPSATVAEDDMTTFQLLLQLQTAGWVCHVKAPWARPSKTK